MIARTRGKLVVPRSEMSTAVDPKDVAIVNMALLEGTHDDEPPAAERRAAPTRFNRFNRVYLQTEVNVT